MIREHWRVENRNHWRREASLWREDRAPKRTARGAKNLALMRSALLAVIAFEDFESRSDAFEYYRDHREKSGKGIKPATPCQG